MKAYWFTNLTDLWGHLSFTPIHPVGLLSLYFQITLALPFHPYTAAGVQTLTTTTASLAAVPRSPPHPHLPGIRAYSSTVTLTRAALPGHAPACHISP